MTPTQPVTESHCFVVAADTQFGMTKGNQDWDAEIEFSRLAVEAINALQPRPLFCCICGDMVDMTASMYAGKAKPPSSDGAPSATWTNEECDALQARQNAAVQAVWSNLHPAIALVCLCGNHDVGNRPTPASIQTYTRAFGDDYLAFWANGTYNIVVNSALFSDPASTRDLYAAQLSWLEDRLQYASAAAGDSHHHHHNHHKARHIFVFSHHPWFLYSEDESAEDLTGLSPLPSYGGSAGGTAAAALVQYIPDSYFHVPLQYRKQAMDLFERYGVSAAFSGHFHQNVVSKSSFGMEMIVTGSLSVVLDSTGNPNDRQEPKTQGIRIVQVEHDPSGGPGKFHHRFVGLT
jgi:hypothetical protein